MILHVCSHIRLCIADKNVPEEQMLDLVCHSCARVYRVRITPSSQTITPTTRRRLVS